MVLDLTLTQKLIFTHKTCGNSHEGGTEVWENEQLKWDLE